MNRNFKKLGAGFSITLLLAGIIFLIPQKTDAQIPVTDYANTFQTSLTAISTSASSFANNSLELKAFVLDTLATTLAKTLIRQITASVVNWINSGFQGSPSFVTNPSAFFLDTADQITGSFINPTGPLASLCSPFSIDVRVALAFKYHPQTQQRYTCTLDAIIKNTVNAGQNASINGFTAGDFNQGGWPAFVTLTTQSQNNSMGAYLQADDELYIKVANFQIQQKNELGAGQGFLSWRDPSCMNQVANYQKAVTIANAPVDETGEQTTEQQNANNTVTAVQLSNVGIAANNTVTGGDVSSIPTSAADCSIQTPGSVIASSLGQSVNGPLQELGVVDSINQIVSALAAQLVTNVLKTGLSAVSGNGPSDPNSYLNQIQNEQQTSPAQLATISAQLSQSMQAPLSNAAQLKSNQDQSLSLILGAQSAYQNVEACYNVKIASSSPPLNALQVTLAQQAISQVDATIAANVTPYVTKLSSEDQDATARLTALTTIQTTANAATDVTSLNTIAQQFAQLQTSNSLTSALDIANSQQELSQTQSTVASLNSDSSQKLLQCNAFPPAAGI